MRPDQGANTMSSSSSEFDLAKLQQQLNSPGELHEFVLQYNWDMGYELPRWVINNPSCDRGTALMIYWMGGVGYYSQYERREDVPKHELTGYDLMREVEQKYLSDFYKTNQILFNPRYDRQKGRNGYDWTRAYDDLPTRRPIPPKMLEPSITDVEWEAMGRPIKPIKKAPRIKIDVQQIINNVNSRKS